MIELKLGDCLEVMKSIPDKSIDLVLTSPPYDNLRDYSKQSWDFEGIAKEVYRIIAEGGVCVWVVNDQMVDGSETLTSFKQALFFKSIGFNAHDTMIYSKNGIGFPNPKRYHQCFEYMFVFSKGQPKTVNLIEDRKNSRAGEQKTNRWERQKNGIVKLRDKEEYQVKEVGARWNIWQYEIGYMKSTTDKIAFDHPAIFPEQLAADHINSWSNEGDTVLDPFMGSGTTIKMAKILKRNAIGIEISKEYFEIAKKRIENTQEMML